VKPVEFGVGRFTPWPLTFAEAFSAIPASRVAASAPSAAHAEQLVLPGDDANVPAALGVQGRCRSR
jgi:hypothetical protein